MLVISHQGSKCQPKPQGVTASHPPGAREELHKTQRAASTGTGRAWHSWALTAGVEDGAADVGHNGGTLAKVS